MSSDTGSNEDTLESFKGVDYETPLSTPLSSPLLTNSITHDTSRSKYHMKDLESFAVTLENSAERAFPNRYLSTARYKNVQALLLRWAEDDLGVAWEVEDLQKTFKTYGFNVETWLIPSVNSHLKLMLKAGTFVEAHERLDTLFIIYYGGHATINRRRQSTWSCKRDLTYATLEWSAIQVVFEKSKSDVLLLLDCCSAASAAPISGRAVTETIAACGWESIAAEPGRFSFTDTLIKVLQDWINRPFTAAMLHCEMLSRLKHENPELMGARRVEIRRTPIYIVTTGDLGASSIYLARLNGASEGDREEPHPGMPQLEASVEEAETVDGTLKTPHVLISLALEENQILDAGACSRWLASFPALAKYAKVESVFKSYSTLLLVSIPVMVWNLLPDNPACSFVGYVCSHNLLANCTPLETVPDLESEKPQLTPKLERPRGYWMESKPKEAKRIKVMTTVDREHLASQREETPEQVSEDDGPETQLRRRLKQCLPKEATISAIVSTTTTKWMTLEVSGVSQLDITVPPGVEVVDESRLGGEKFASETGASVPRYRVVYRMSEDHLRVVNLGDDGDSVHGKVIAEEGGIDSSQNEGTVAVRGPPYVPSNPLPLLRLPNETSKHGFQSTQYTSPFRSSGAGSFCSASSSEGSRNDRLWPPSRSTSISTATDWSSPLSGSHWSPIGVVSTSLDMHNPLPDEVDWYRRAPHTTSPVSNRQHLVVPLTSSGPHHSDDERVRYYCTFPNCTQARKGEREGYWSYSKTDLRKHEESAKHWPQEKFICLECPSAINIHGHQICPFCSTRFSPLGDARTHYLQCHLAWENGKTFFRRDHLLMHLKDQHKMEDMGEQIKSWSFPIESDWPRQCGFCGIYFDAWNERTNHIGMHFENGSNIQDWRLPFPGPKDTHPREPALYGRKDNDDDDNNNDKATTNLAATSV